MELQSGTEATTQFQKIVDNRGVAPASIYWPLSHLGLARAYAVTGESDKSLAQYREFLALWKNADPDLPLLEKAKVEYTALSRRGVGDADPNEPAGALYGFLPKNRLSARISLSKSICICPESESDEESAVSAFFGELRIPRVARNDNQ